MMATGTDVKRALNLLRVIDDMCDDPDLTGDLLLFAITTAHVTSRRRHAPRRLPKRHWLEEVAEAVGCDTWWVQRMIGRDVPRFEAPNLSGHRACVAPMIRRDGPCGKPGVRGGPLRDPDTGEFTYAWACSRHRREMAADIERRRRAWIANGSPQPAPNTGGVLPRYFTTDWNVYYDWAAPWRKPADTLPEPTPPRPQLRLIQGGATRTDHEPTEESHAADH